MTKASPLHLIDRLQFPWLTASIPYRLPPVMLTTYNTSEADPIKKIFSIYCAHFDRMWNFFSANQKASYNPL